MSVAEKLSKLKRTVEVYQDAVDDICNEYDVTLDNDELEIPVLALDKAFKELELELVGRNIIKPKEPTNATATNTRTSS
jgi:hypothetical protein